MVDFRFKSIIKIGMIGTTNYLSQTSISVDLNKTERQMNR